MVDYADIARKFGAKNGRGEVSFAPEQPAAVDYGALARQFGATATEAAPAIPELPEELPAQRRTWPETIAEGITNFLPSAYKFGAETASMLNPANLPETARGLELTGYGALRAAAEKALPTDAFAYLSTLENPEFAAQAQQAAQAAGAHYARYFSEPGWQEAIATDPVGTMADISMLANGVGGGLRGLARRGLAGGNAAPLADLAFRAGSVTDPLQIAAKSITRVGVPLMTKGAEMANRIASPRYYALQQAVGNQGRPIVNALRSAQQLVPGSQPTAGAVAAPVGLTGFSGLTMSAMKELPDEYRRAEQVNIAAREKALETAAGGPKGVERAKAAREGVTGPMYDIAKKQKVAEDAALQKIMSKPFIQDVARVAKSIADNKGERFRIGKTAPAGTVRSTIPEMLAGAPPTRNVAATFAKYSVRDLHNMKLAMDKIITKGPTEFGIDRMDINALKQARREFVNWLDNASPEYRAAREEYARLSKPVNRAEVLSYLKDTLEGVMKGEQRGRAFVKAAAKDAPKTIQKAIDAAPRYQDLSQILTPAEVDLVKNIARDLEREEQFADLAKWRGQVGPKAQKLGEAASIKIPTFIGDWTAILATRVFKGLQGKIGEREAMQIAVANLDPKSMAVLLGEAMMAERKMKGPIAKRKAAMESAAQVMRSPEMLAAQRAYNAMVEEPQNRNAMAR
jgi:hypothetical protein